MQATISPTPRQFQGVDFNNFKYDEVGVITTMVASCVATLESCAAGQLSAVETRKSIQDAHDRATVLYPDAQYLTLRLREAWDPR